MNGCSGLCACVRLTAEQLELKQQLRECDDVQWLLHTDTDAAASDDANAWRVQRLAGVDISFLKGSNEHACASIVVLEYPSLRVLYEAFTYVSLPAPYIPGFLAFREVPALSKLYADLLERCPSTLHNLCTCFGARVMTAWDLLLFHSLTRRSSLYVWLLVQSTALVPDITLVDGNGVLHPQGFGLASHFGVLMDIPTIGVGKTFLHVDGLTKGDVKTLMAQAKRDGDEVVKIEGKSGKVRARVSRRTVLCLALTADSKCVLMFFLLLSLSLSLHVVMCAGLGSSALQRHWRPEPSVCVCRPPRVARHESRSRRRVLALSRPRADSASRPPVAPSGSRVGGARRRHHARLVLGSRWLRAAQATVSQAPDWRQCVERLHTSQPLGDRSHAFHSSTAS